MNINPIRFSLFLLGLAFLIGMFSITNVFASQNELALGQNAKIKDSIDISINPMEEIDYKSQSEILNRRKNWLTTILVF